MKTISWGMIGAALLLVSLAPAGRADGGMGGNGGNSVRWRTIIGIIQAGNVVGGIAGGGQPGRRKAAMPMSISRRAWSISR